MPSVLVVNGHPQHIQCLRQSNRTYLWYACALWPYMAALTTARCFDQEDEVKCGWLDQSTFPGKRFLLVVQKLDVLFFYIKEIVKQITRKNYSRP